ncbi:unnamed protein product, partial [Brassica oleracea var. botrytis]
RVEWLLFLFLNLLFFTYTSAQGTCPRNALQIGAFTNVLNAIGLTLGNPPPPVPPCRSLIAGLADLEAAVCLCTALDVNVLGINVHLPIDISVLFNACSRFAPPSFQCPSYMKNCVRSMVTATSILWRSNKTHSVMNAEGLAFRAEVSRQIWFLVFGFQSSGTSFTSTAPEPVTCFLHHIFTFGIGGSFQKRGMTSGGKWFVLHPNNVIGSSVLNGGTSLESLEAKNYFWTGMYLFSRSNFRFISDSLVPSCWLWVRDFNKQLYWYYYFDPICVMVVETSFFLVHKQMALRTSLALFLFLNLLFFTYTSAQGTCPRNALQIGACTNVLNAIDLTLGNPPPPVPPCCSLIAGLADLEAAVCLCTALDVNVLGINVHLPIDISVLFNACSRFAPPSFQCPFKVSARHGPSLELVMDRLLLSAWVMELGGPIVAFWASRTLVRRSGTSFTSTAPEPVTCFLHHIFTFVFGGGSFWKRGITSGGKWFVLHPNNVIGSFVLNGGTSFESLEAKNYFWTGMYLFSRPNFRFISDSLVPSCWPWVRDFNKRFCFRVFLVHKQMAPRTSLALFLFLNLLFFTYTSAQGTCPRNALQIGACTNVLNAIDLTLGNPPPPVPPCCSLIAGLADLEAAVCLCTALDVNVLGINVHLPIDISVLFNACSRFAPPSFQCP